MMIFLYGATPHAHLTRNSLFNVESRREEWGSTGRSLVSYSRLSLLGVGGALLLIWLLLGLSDQWQDASVDFTALMFGLSLLAGMVLDFASLAATLQSINSETSSGRWDLLRLTSLSDSEIVAAKHGLAQIQTWRLMGLIVALRLTVSVMIFLTAFIVLFHLRPLNFLAAIDVVFLALGYGWIAILLGALYVIEPIWRMRAVTALGVALSSATRFPAINVLIAGILMLVFWIVQIVLIAGLLYVLNSFFSSLTAADLAVDQYSLYPALFLLGLLVPIVYGLYSVVQAWSLHRAEDWLSRLN